MEKRLYITTNLVNGKVYAGKHNWKEGTKYMGSGYALKKAFTKYGKENFKIRWLRLKITTSEDLDRMEIRLIRLLKYRYGKNCYNIQKGGCGGYFIYYMTEEQRQEVFNKISESKRKQYAEGLTDKQIEGRNRAKITLTKSLHNAEVYDRVFVVGNENRIKSLKERRETVGLTDKEKLRNSKILKYSFVYVTYKLIYPNGDQIIETNTLKDFRSKYHTEDIVFSHIKKHGFLEFKRRISTTKHIFPVGTELHYISELRGDEHEKTVGSSVPTV